MINFMYVSHLTGVYPSSLEIQSSTIFFRFGFSIAAAMRSLSFICLLTKEINKISFYIDILQILQEESTGFKPHPEENNNLDVNRHSLSLNKSTIYTGVTTSSTLWKKLQLITWGVVAKVHVKLKTMLVKTFAFEADNHMAFSFNFTSHNG